MTIYKFSDLTERETYQEGLINKNAIKHGQKKLCIIEIFFLSKVLEKLKNEEKITLIYIGSSPGHHIEILIKLYPQITEFILIDGRTTVVKQTPKVTVLKEFFLKEKKYIQKFKRDNPIIFISDIRSSDGYENPEIEDLIYDYSLQNYAVETLKPFSSLLKFRYPFPFEIKKTISKLTLLGEIFLQPNTGIDSSEVRIMITDTDNLTYMPLNKKLSKEFEEKIYYYNKNIRNDSELEKYYLKKSLKQINKHNSFLDEYELSKYIVKELIKFKTIYKDIKIEVPIKNIKQ